MYDRIHPNQIYHIYNRSVLKILLFRSNIDYLRFMQKIAQVRTECPVKIVAYCLMPTHYHLLLEEPPISSRNGHSNISKFMQRLQNSHAKYFGIKYKHSGRVFQGVFKRKHIKSDDQLGATIAYIHENPVRKKLVKNAGKWPYSSASNPNL